MRDSPIYSYDKQYFEKGTGYFRYGKEVRFRITSFLWVRFMCFVWRPKKVLDVGCATGQFVALFRKLGVEAYGIDTSSYAISHIPKALRTYCQEGYAQKLPYTDNSFDFVYTMDVLEHISENDIPRVLQECSRVTNKWMIHKINTGIMERFHHDSTHVTLKSIRWWCRMFSKQGIHIHLVIFLPMTWIIVAKKNG